MNPIEDANNKPNENQENNLDNAEEKIIIGNVSQGEKDEIIEEEKQVKEKERKEEGKKEKNLKGEEPKKNEDKKEGDNSLKIADEKEIDIESLNLEEIKNLFKEQKLKYAKLEEERDRMAKENDKISKKNELYKAQLKAHNIPIPPYVEKDDDEIRNKKSNNGE